MLSVWSMNKISLPSAFLSFAFRLVLLSALLSGCQSAPSRNILGSYFPSWMLCALIGILLAVIAQKVFVRAGIDEVIPAKLWVYLSLTVSLTFFTWLICFGN
jgi:cation transporter-like permease